MTLNTRPPLCARLISVWPNNPPSVTKEKTMTTEYAKDLERFANQKGIGNLHSSQVKDLTENKERLTAALFIAVAVADAIKELGQVPSGHLYARLMGKLSLDQYESLIRTLCNSGVIREDGNHLLHWIGGDK